MNADDFKTPPQALGVMEMQGATPALVAVDAMEKAADVRVIQLELNDFLGVCIKIAGKVAAVDAALAAATGIVERMGVASVAKTVPAPSARAWPAIFAPPEINPLLEQDVVYFPSFEPAQSAQGKSLMASDKPGAIGFIETQGFTAVIDAIDAACKAANVEVVGKEKLGGGYVTIVIKGDVAAVKAAIEAGKERVEGLGKLVAAHVIARPSAAVLSVLPRT